MIKLGGGFPNESWVMCTGISVPVLNRFLVYWKESRLLTSVLTELI